MGDALWLMRVFLDAISVPAAKVQECNEKMVHFSLLSPKDASGMMTFLVGCHRMRRPCGCLQKRRA